MKGYGYAWQSNDVVVDSEVVLNDAVDRLIDAARIFNHRFDVAVAVDSRTTSSGNTLRCTA